VEAAKLALDKYGFGSTGSPVTTGQTDLHVELCEKIARIHNKEAALLFNSGYAANIGIISAVTTLGDLVIADQLCHASIQDGMTMSKATSRFFKHNSPEQLRAILEKERANYNGCLVITEGVFSMDGDVACLDKIYAIAREFNCRLMVDQAHCFGVVGPNGLGVCDKYNLLKETDIIMGTFSKMCGGIGGFVTGSKELIEWLRHFSRAQIFSVSLPPSTVAAVSKSLDIFISDKSILESLRLNIKHFLFGLETIGVHVEVNHESAVVPVVIGDESVMGEMYQSLLDDGIICTPVVYPAVGRKNCRFRFTVMAKHSKSDLDYAVACLEKAMLKTSFSFDLKNQTKKVA
jgi:glycine C-acetyltransferase